MFSLQFFEISKNTFLQSRWGAGSECRTKDMRRFEIPSHLRTSFLMLPKPIGVTPS